MHLMTPDHPAWADFWQRLEDIECHGNSNGTFDLLNAFPGIDPKLTLELYRRLGGACDCTIWQVAQPWIGIGLTGWRDDDGKTAWEQELESGGAEYDASDCEYQQALAYCERVKEATL